MGMIPTMAVNVPTVPTRKFANIPTSHKPVITIQNTRVKFLTVDTTVMLGTPETTVKTLVIITRVSFQLNAKLPTTRHIGIAMSPPKISGFKLFLTRRTTITIRTIVKVDQIVAIENFPTTVTSGESITPTITTITITISARAQIITSVPTLATSALMPASSFPTIFTELITVNNGNLVIAESLATTIADIPILGCGTIHTKPRINTLMGIEFATQIAALPIH
jgi:hypothetical protein